ncbi:MAG TPA: hypothetical protein VGT07_15070, partial [Steroidobacteraceae bacterium]|nr:hypothetical protein [Steroidobacteraceae bacterium]
AILENLFRKEPRHPGLAHYIIHSYDFPPLAARALVAARAYAKIAPDSPHALHMPSHIFTRLGLWDESIGSNVASIAAARREQNITEELHASDYLLYAYLQSGRDAAAKRVMDLGEAPSCSLSVRSADIRVDSNLYMFKIEFTLIYAPAGAVRETKL